jgi:thioredoxin reductase (NADPH)
MQDDANALYDVTIVGGGPVGLFGAFYAGMRQMKTKILDSLPELGGQLSTLYPEKYVFDMPGFPKVLAKDLAANMVEQAMRFHPTICLSEMVLQLAHEADGTITLTTQRGTHRTRTLIIATGAGAFAPKRLGTPGVEEFEDRGVHYFVRNKAQFAGKRLLIVGGGDSAVDWAMNLEEIADTITLIHRRDKFRCHEESLDWLLNRSRVNTVLWNELKCIQGDDCVRQAIVFDNRTKEEKTLDVDAVLLNIGFSADLGPIKQWGVKLVGHSIPVNQLMQVEAETGGIMPGVYAAGDINTFPGKIKLIATGVGEILTAVCHAKTQIDPSAKLFPGHSSNMEL